MSNTCNLFDLQAVHHEFVLCPPIFPHISKTTILMSQQNLITLSFFFIFVIKTAGTLLFYIIHYLKINEYKFPDTYHPITSWILMVHNLSSSILLKIQGRAVLSPLICCISPKAPHYMIEHDCSARGFCTGFLFIQIPCCCISLLLMGIFLCAVDSG